MSDFDVVNLVAVVPVTNYQRAVQWYARLLGREADVVPIDDVAEWQLAEHAWLQVGADPDRSGSTTVIIGVRDVEATRSFCLATGITLGEVVEYPGIIKMAEILDPDGNKVAFVQDISGGR